MELHGKHFLSFLAVVFFIFVFWPKEKSALRLNDSETNESFEISAKGKIGNELRGAEKSEPKKLAPDSARTQLKSVSQINRTSFPAAGSSPSESIPGGGSLPSQTLTEKFIEQYEKADLVEVLRNSLPLDAINSMVLASQSAYLIMTKKGEVRIYSSLRRGPLANQAGCVSIRDKTTIRGSLADSTMSLFKLPEPDAFAILLRKDTLLVYFGDTSTWGQENRAEDPRIIIYYRKNLNGSWVFLGKGKDGLAVNSSPNQSEEEFCDMP